MASLKENKLTTILSSYCFSNEMSSVTAKLVVFSMNIDGQEGISDTMGDEEGGTELGSIRQTCCMQCKDMQCHPSWLGCSHVLLNCWLDGDDIALVDLQTSTTSCMTWYKSWPSQLSAFAESRNTCSSGSERIA